MARHQLKFNNKEEVLEWALKTNPNQEESKSFKFKDRDFEFYKNVNMIKSCVSNGIRSGYKTKSKANNLIGCSYEQVVKHIEKQFLKGMSWENKHLWHIDHIIPIANAKTIDEVIKLSHFTNLRPMWAKDNIRKKDKNLFLI